MGGGPGDRQVTVRPICSGTYNIHNGRDRGLESSLRGMSQANMYLGVFQETKLIKSMYTRESGEYRVVETEPPSANSGVLPYSIERSITSPWRCSRPIERTFSAFSWSRATGGGLLWGTTWP